MRGSVANGACEWIDKILGLFHMDIDETFTSICLADSLSISAVDTLTVYVLLLFGPLLIGQRMKHATVTRT